MKNDLIVREAYYIQNKIKLLVFNGYDKYELSKNDILSDGINEYKVMGFNPNLLQDTLTITVESDNFDKDALVGKELRLKNMRQESLRPQKRQEKIANERKAVYK